MSHTPVWIRHALVLLCAAWIAGGAHAQARFVQTPYAEPKAVFDFYLDHPAKIGCGLALQDYGYTMADMQDFIEVTPSAITELVHWQNQGYGLITPVVTEKILSIESIR